MKIDANILAAEIAAKKKPSINVEAEVAHVIDLINREDIAPILEPYDYGYFIAPGGSGLVFEVTDRRSRSPRALKLSRKSAAQPLDADPENPVNVDLEIEALSLVSHQHITRFYDGKRSQDNHYCIITQLVSGARNLDEWLTDELEVDPSLDADLRLNRVLCDLAGKLLGYASALRYMHESLGLFHMDLKPGNLLVDSSGSPFVTDLGFARSRSRYRPSDHVPVGFTFGYAHPDLIGLGKFRAPSTLAKARNLILADHLDARYDLFAFGRTLLALLFIVEGRFGERAKGNYTFLYLHLVATMLLDGRNVATAAAHSHREFASEVALGIKDDLLQRFTFRSFDEVENRVERLLGRRPIENKLDELNPWYPRSLNHAEGFLNVTPRIRAIIEHPAFRRLRHVSQLGLVDEVYAGATHTRYAHSLGVTGMVCQCLSALYNDPENPIFNVLSTRVDIKEMILATLIHDLGQSDFGHELEEVDNAVFSHSKITALLVEHETFKDSRGRTLRNIIEGRGYDEWGVPAKHVLGILGEGTAPRFQVFSDLIDGPLDADKLDYLRRDGDNCNVTYPRGLDIERLLRSITVLPVPQQRHLALRLGVREKGLASSEAITIARHKMYQSVYLQHTVRSLKTMIVTACARAHGRVKAELAEEIGATPLFADDSLSEMFMAHLVGFAPTFRGATQDKEKRALGRIWKKIKAGYIEFSEHGYSGDRSVSFFYGHMAEGDRKLLSDFHNRRVYKRLADVSFAALSSSNLDSVRDALSWNKRGAVLDTMERELKKVVTKTLEDRSAVRESLNFLPHEIQELLPESQSGVLIADLPLRVLGTGGSPPPVLSDIGRKRGQYDDSSAGVGHIWREGMDKMMKEISICRIFAEPRFFEIVTSVLDQTAIDDIVRKSVPGWVLS